MLGRLPIGLLILEMPLEPRRRWPCTLVKRLSDISFRRLKVGELKKLESVLYANQVILEATLTLGFHRKVTTTQVAVCAAGRTILAKTMILRPNCSVERTQTLEHVRHTLCCPDPWNYEGLPMRTSADGRIERLPKMSMGVGREREEIADPQHLQGIKCKTATVFTVAVLHSAGSGGSVTNPPLTPRKPVQHCHHPVDLLAGVVERDGGSHGGFLSEAAQDGLGAVVA